MAAIMNAFPTKPTPRQFRALFGVSIQTVIILWQFLQTIQSSIDLPFVLHPSYLLWALYFMKVYPSCDVACNKWQCDAKTFRLWAWRVIFLLHLFLNTVKYC
jgi:hypothetical protein